MVGWGRVGGRLRQSGEGDGRGGEGRVRGDEMQGGGGTLGLDDVGLRDAA